VPNGLLLDHRQAREHGEIVHIGWASPHQTRTDSQAMLRIERAPKQALEIHRAPRTADLWRVYLLEAKDIRLEPVELWAQHGRAIFEGGPLLVRTEVFEIESGDSHRNLGQKVLTAVDAAYRLSGANERIALQIFSSPKCHTAVFIHGLD
jgi:hypothetical protein